MTVKQVPSFAFLGSANWQLAAEYLQERAPQVWGDAWQALPLPFGQYRTQLIDEQSILRQNAPDILIFCERIEDLLPEAYGQYSPSQEALIRQHFADYLACLSDARQRLRGTFFVFDFAPVRAFVQALEDTAYRQHASLTRLVFELNSQLAEFCAGLPDCHILPLSACVQRVGSEQAWSLKYWALGRFPYTPAFSDELVECLLSAQQVLLGKTARVLVLDLDNTLWGGVIGDDGLTGIQLGPDYPGNLHVAIQHVAKALRERGVVLALCSKNTEAIALEAIESHPGMILRKDDFLIRKINWQPKADNLREISAEIGVGLASLCFIDDSPYEREAVRAALPEVFVPELPEDPVEWADFIAWAPCFAHFTLTQEDRERAERYQARQQVLAAQGQFSSREDYWRSLEMQLFFTSLRDTNRQRVLQLISKTNQFNTTTRRHGENEIAALLAEGAQVLAISLADRYAAREIIGVLILRPTSTQTLEIETFLLSCRVLGRSVETGVLGWAASFAVQQGYAELHGLFVGTERNQPAAPLYPEHGFTALPDGQYRYDLKDQSLAVPDWFEVSDEQ